MDFLFYLFFIGIFIASLQDLKRREVDNYLNFFLLVSGAGFLIFSSISELNFWILILAGFSFLIMVLIGNLFYYSKIFAGGDAKLLIAMFALFVASSFSATLANIGIFVLFLLFSGSIYGTVYAFVLFFIRFKKTLIEARKQIKKLYFRLGILAGIVLFALSYIDFLFLFLSLFAFLITILFVFAKSVENTAMIKQVSYKDLREGDWLLNDIKVKGKTIKADFEGLTKQDLKVLKNYKKKVTIKEGIPFVPAIFIAFLLYVFSKELLISFLLGFI